MTTEPGPPSPLEVAIRARFDANDLDGAIAKALEAYADELFGFLIGLARDRTQAEDAFSAACERMWRSLARFRWDSSFRVWAYRIARNEFLRTTREVTRARKNTPISQIASIREAVDRVHNTTPAHQRTEVKDRFAKLRAELDPEDHMLLGLRLDRKLAWTDIAKVLAASDDDPSTREVAALRKKFERLKVKLRELAKDA